MDEKDDISVDLDRPKRPWYAINKRYVPLKLMYFFFMAGQTSSTTYRAIFMRHLGLSTKQTGMIWTIERIFIMFIPYLIGGFTDKTRKPKAILLTLIIIGAITQCSMYFIPQERYVESELGRPVSIEEIASGKISFCWTVNCSLTHGFSLSSPYSSTKSCHFYVTDTDSTLCDVTLANLLKSCVPREDVTANISSRTTSLVPQCLSTLINSSIIFPDELPNNATLYSLLLHFPNDFYLGKDYNTSSLCYEKSNSTVTSCETLVPNPVDEYGVTFWLFTVLILISSITGAGVAPVLEATTFGVLGKKNRHRYGQQRVWAAVGSGITALAIGYFKDFAAYSGPGDNREFLPMFLAVLICWSCAAVVSFKLPIKNEKSTKKVRLRDIKTILYQSKAIAFYIALLVFGMTNAIHQIYLFWFIEAKLNSPSSVFGIATFLGCFLDILFYLLSGYLIKTFGHVTLFCFGMTAYAVRVGAATFIVNYWQLLATESLKGIAWGLTWVVILSYTSKISPKGLENSSMGITQGVVRGVAFSIGALLGGIIYQSKGGDFLLLLFGSMNVIAAVLFAIFVLGTRKSDEAIKEEDAAVWMTSDDGNGLKSKGTMSIKNTEVS